MKPYLACSEENLKQENVCEESNPDSDNANRPGGILFLALSKMIVLQSNESVFEPKRKWWKIMADQRSVKE